MTSLDLVENLLGEFATSLEPSLLEVLPDSQGMEEQVIDAMRYALFAGGKRLRPFLVVMTSRLFSVEEENAIRVAAAIECLHTYSLIHDDLPAMDNDDVRRGKPSVHKKFDEATAVLAGDALLTLCFEILSDVKTHSDPEIRCELIATLSRAVGALGMVGGQMIDLKSENQSLIENEINRMQQMKTGALIVFSCEAGAILAQVKGKRRDALKHYGRDIGLAFQIVDDLLDIERSSLDIGKTAGKDIRAGKATIVSLIGAGNAKIKADKLINQAIKGLEIFDDKANILRSLAAFVVGRNY
ncbi:MAG: polyprenyl synthetase family protein [Kordiimonadaceae bacterium]|nr:polyprenyl synthetase family protein [Kordiimonadaceae bacterium]MBT6134000.1 polyprenyl synthetase family protein [Kordiimonadaceae bacterium]MBT6466157.1 polyprenyl synthetase family protein [Kordiimonadaceae bacterium]MBT7544195.1 polyprenyl synthetase family protein [Kordiimonadaceae bacterium]MBT7605752.1 polyprenyl synthetase family protein [Kordiimonadaceae bacterium]